MLAKWYYSCYYIDAYPIQRREISCFLNSLARTTSPFEMKCFFQPWQEVTQQMKIGYMKPPGLECLNLQSSMEQMGPGKAISSMPFSFLRNLVVNSINHQPGQGIRQLPFKLDGFGKESSYKIQFITNGVRYVFGFSLKDLLVTEEYLYYFPNNRQTRIFERSADTFIAGSKFRGKFSACKDVLKPNRLLLSCAANFSAVQEVADVFNFFNNELVVYDPGKQDNWMNYSMYQMNSNPKIKAAVIAFLSELGTGIKDIQVSIDQKKQDELLDETLKEIGDDTWQEK